MKEDSQESGNDGTLIMVGIVGLIILAAIVYTYYHYAPYLLKISLVISILSFMFGLSVLIKHYEAYSFNDWRSGYFIWIPTLSMIICLLIIYMIKSRTNGDLVSLAQKTNNHLIFTYSDLTQDQAVIGFRYFLALLVIIICEGWYVLSFLNFMAEQRNREAWGAIARTTKFFAYHNWSLIIMLLVSAALTFG